MSYDQFIKLSETATLPEQDTDHYILYSNRHIILDRGYVRNIATGVAFAPPVSNIYKIIHLEGSNWTTIPGQIGGGDEREIKIKLGSITSEGVEINLGDPICKITSSTNIPPVSTVSEAQINDLREAMLIKLSNSTIKKIV